MADDDQPQHHDAQRLVQIEEPILEGVPGQVVHGYAERHHRDYDGSHDPVQEARRTSVLLQDWRRPLLHLRPPSLIATTTGR